MRIDVPCREINQDGLSTIDMPLFQTPTMACSQKKSVEVISSDEGSDELNMKNPDNSESDKEEQEDQNSHLPAPLLIPLTPPATTKKRKRVKRRRKNISKMIYTAYNLIHLFTAPETSAEITYMLTLTSAAELKKAALKHKTKSANLQLNSDEPFDTFKAQILIKISRALKPQIENIANYKIHCTINCVISKPRMDMEYEADYVMMVESALKSKSPYTVNISAEEITGANKENEQNKDSNDNEVGKKKKKKVHICAILLQYLNLIILLYRNNCPSMLQTMRRWRMFKTFMKSGLARSQDPLVEALTALLILKPTHIFHLVMSILMLGGCYTELHIARESQGVPKEYIWTSPSIALVLSDSKDSLRTPCIILIKRGLFRESPYSPTRTDQGFCRDSARTPMI